MQLNADFSKRVMVLPDEADWVDSPASGVERLMLDRIGGEVARATSIVRYAAGSSFAAHEHELGEEILVLAGFFADEHGEYPPGSYLRNPPGSGHTPYSKDGCRMLVKLRQFDPADLEALVVHSADTALWPASDRNGIATLRLHAFGDERVLMKRLATGSILPLGHNAGGAELLLVSGSLHCAGRVLPAESWLRLPPGDLLVLTAAEDSIVWIKSGHLRLS